jgi:hypothetical protein
MSMSGETLKEGLPAVGEGAGLVLRCGPNAEDRRLFLVARNRPFHDVMGQLTQFVPYPPGKAAWFKSGSGYVFDEDLASKQARERAAAARRRTAEQQRRTRFRAMQAWIRPNPDDSRPTAVGRLRVAAFLEIFQGMPSTQREQALMGRRAIAPYRMLSPRGQALARRRLGIDDAHWAEFGPQYRQLLQAAFVEAVPTGPPARPGLEIRVRRSPREGGSMIQDILNAPKWNPAEGWDWSDHWKEHVDRRRGPKDAEKNPDLQGLIRITGGPEQTIEKVL